MKIRNQNEPLADNKSTPPTKNKKTLSRLGGKSHTRRSSISTSIIFATLKLPRSTNPSTRKLRGGEATPRGSIQPKPTQTSRLVRTFSVSLFMCIRGASPQYADRLLVPDFSRANTLTTLEAHHLKNLKAETLPHPLRQFIGVSTKGSRGGRRSTHASTYSHVQKHPHTPAGRRQRFAATRPPTTETREISTPSFPLALRTDQRRC